MKKDTSIACLLIYFLFFVLCTNIEAQDDTAIKKMIADFKVDERGPFQAIRWFCKDGTVLRPDQKCNTPGGVQHALHKDTVHRLAQERGIYLGQILAGTPFEDFLDSKNHYSRLKQYLLEKYLRKVDDGWILRKARYYRGAYQEEDEAGWSREFLIWALNDDDAVASCYFLLREASKALPHRAFIDRWAVIRNQSKMVSDAYPPFLNLRIKLHGMPEKTDIQTLKSFEKIHEKKLPENILSQLRELIRSLEIAYAPTDMNTLKEYLPRFPENSPVRHLLDDLVRRHHPKGSKVEIKDECRRISELLLMIRQRIILKQSGKIRLSLANLSIDLESIFFRSIQDFQAKTIRERFEKFIILAEASAGCGYLELWEWEQAAQIVAPDAMVDHMDVVDFKEKADYCRRIVEWASGMIRAVYFPVTDMFLPFEPMAGGFMDDRIRSSVLLSMGAVAGDLAAVANEAYGNRNTISGLVSVENIRGMNPGYAAGELVVVESNTERVSFKGDKIYAMSHVPNEIPPVAGILSVSEGNLVSHVQLLARNLGIPNAVITDRHFKELKPLSGQHVFYAVSPGGIVLLKPASDMNDSEKALAEQKKRSEERVMIPLKKIDLKHTDLISLKKIRASDSGRICGPKAANLGQLKHLFPDQVADGLVIPFGVFKAHMNQPMAENGQTYWSFLTDTFKQDTIEGKQSKDSEKNTLERLNYLRIAIEKMSFLPGFENRFKERFRDEFGTDPGTLPVFIRSDTNMEDLKEFSGAGLNLTIFNVLEADKIWQGIRDVWGSPFRERSYLWRQKFMLNPENVFPSILILPSIAVDKSGVLIIRGLSSGNDDDVTIAFSTGPGGAVEGQAAETWLIKPGGKYMLLSPSREAVYHTLSATGGVRSQYKSFDMRILRTDELDVLARFAQQIKTVLPGVPGINSPGPFDAELGFKGQDLWLFQVRPFVENRRARASDYLRSMDPGFLTRKSIRLNEAGK